MNDRRQKLRQRLRLLTTQLPMVLLLFFIMVVVMVQLLLQLPTGGHQPTSCDAFQIIQLLSKNTCQPHRLYHQKRLQQQQQQLLRSQPLEIRSTSSSDSSIRSSKSNYDNNSILHNDDESSAGPPPESFTMASSTTSTTSPTNPLRRKLTQLRQSMTSWYTTTTNNSTTTAAEGTADSSDDDDDDSSKALPFRQRLMKMGLATILSYGFVSNMSYAITVACAWYIHNIQTGQSPLYPHQWKSFLLVYSGFWIFNNIVRPIRLGISIAMVAPQFDRIILFIQQKWMVSRNVAIGITVILANIVGTITAMSLGIVIASLLSGVPIFPPPLI